MDCTVCKTPVELSGDINAVGRMITVPGDGATRCSSCEEFVHVRCVSSKNGALCQDCERALEAEAAA